MNDPDSTRPAVSIPSFTHMAASFETAEKKIPPKTEALAKAEGALPPFAEEVQKLLIVGFCGAM